VEHEYQRTGALALLAALDVRTGKVFASCPPATGISPFMALMGQVMSHEQYKNAPRVFVIVDNGSGHRGKKAARRLRGAYPNAIMIHTPVHASWLNQIEIVFSIVQKKVLKPASPANQRLPRTRQLAGSCLITPDELTEPPTKLEGGHYPILWMRLTTAWPTTRSPDRKPCTMPPRTLACLRNKIQQTARG
jgi:hypothetical protein